MQIRKAGGQYFVSIIDGPPVNRQKPAVDVLFSARRPNVPGAMFSPSS